MFFLGARFFSLEKELLQKVEPRISFVEPEPHHVFLGADWHKDAAPQDWPEHHLAHQLDSSLSKRNCYKKFNLESV
jgi:hypothetical protein